MEQIIASRLDNDFYNFTMGQLVWKYHYDTVVKYRLGNRTNFDLTTIDLDRLRTEIALLRATPFSDADIAYLETLGVFSTEYLHWLRMDHSLPEVEISTVNGNLSVAYVGPWADAVFWETPLLAMLNRLANEARRPGVFPTNRETWKARDKNTLIKRSPVGFKFMEFGSRRRYSFEWQKVLLEGAVRSPALASHIMGTSNVHLARELEIKPLGTMAHQLFMVSTALMFADGVKKFPQSAQYMILDQFEEMYGDHPSYLTFLPDTYGTDFGLSHFTRRRAERWSGVRQDSGDPFNGVSRVLNYYKSHGIDAKTKNIIPSDGLTVTKALSLYDTFHEDTNIFFGIGTSYTNDTELEPLNIVIKPEAANGVPCVKFSDSPGKVTGDRAMISHIEEAIRL